MIVDQYTPETCGQRAPLLALWRETDLPTTAPYDPVADVARDDPPPDLRRASLEGLEWLLRHRRVWPSDFAWYFPSCRHCGMGLAARAWPDQVGETELLERMAEAMGMAVDDVVAVFCCPWSLCPRLELGLAADVRPEDVAEVIRVYLAGRS